MAHWGRIATHNIYKLMVYCRLEAAISAQPIQTELLLGAEHVMKKGYKDSFSETKSDKFVKPMNTGH